MEPGPDPYAPDPGVPAEQPAPSPQPAPAPAPAEPGPDNSALQQQIADLKQQVAELQQENQALQQQNSILQNQVQQAQAEIEAEKNQVDQLNMTLEQEKSDHQADAAEAQRIIDDLNNKVSAAGSGDNQDPQAAAQLTTLQSENQALKDQIAQLQSGQGSPTTSFTSPEQPRAGMADAVPPPTINGGGMLPGGRYGAPHLGPGFFANIPDLNTPPEQDGPFDAPPDRGTIEGHDTGNGSASQIYGPDNMPAPAATVPASAVNDLLNNPAAQTQTQTLPSGAVVIHYRGPNGEDMTFSRDNLSVADANAATNAWTASVNADVAQRNQTLAEDKEKYKREVLDPRDKENFNRTTEATLEAARLAARGKEAPKGLTLEQGLAQRNAELAPPSINGRAPAPLSGSQLVPLDPNQIQRDREAANQRATQAMLEQQKQDSINQTQLAIAAMNKKPGFRTPSFGRFRR